MKNSHNVMKWCIAFRILSIRISSTFEEIQNEIILIFDSRKIQAITE